MAAVESEPISFIIFSTVAFSSRRSGNGTNVSNAQ